MNTEVVNDAPIKSFNRNFLMIHIGLLSANIRDKFGKKGKIGFL